MNHTDRKLRENVLTWEFFGFRTEGFFVEVGANHPRKGSQTWLLERVGWRGILIEPLPASCELLRRERPHSRVVQAAVSAPENAGERSFFVGKADIRSSLAQHVDDPGVVYESTIRVAVRTLDSVLVEAAAPAVDFLSIDVEGTELDVLQGTDLARWKPKLILIEDKLHNLSKHRHLVAGGYKLVKRTGQNNWYIPQNEPFGLTTLHERLDLWRKLYLGLPFRRLRRWNRAMRARTG
jgi:FkbM family methyltransferase